MSALSHQQIANQIKGVLTEALEGPPEGFAYFSDRGESAGFLPLLERLNASQASMVIDGSTIAGQVHHLAFSLNASKALLRQEGTRPNWAESWSVSDVGVDAWQGLVAELQRARDGFLSAVDDCAFENEMTVGIVLGNMAHLAYHLALVRQKARQVAPLARVLDG